MRAAVLRIGGRDGFATIVNDHGSPGVHDLRLEGPYGALLDVGHQEGTVVTLRGGTFLTDTGRPCA